MKTLSIGLKPLLVAKDVRNVRAKMSRSVYMYITKYKDKVGSPELIRDRTLWVFQLIAKKPGVRPCSADSDCLVRHVRGRY